jgi:hypothetical protein
MLVDRAPLMPEAESLALPLRGPKHAPVARFRVLLLVVQSRRVRNSAETPAFRALRNSARRWVGLLVLV